MHATAIETISRLQQAIQRAYHADEDAQDALRSEGKLYSFDILSIITLISQIIPLFALCKKQPPPPTPVPADLVTQGVKAKPWRDANDAKWLAQNNYNAKKDSYNAATIRQIARKIAEEDGISIRAARPKAITFLDAARTEDVKAMAITFSAA